MIRRECATAVPLDPALRASHVATTLAFIQQVRRRNLPAIQWILRHNNELDLQTADVGRNAFTTDALLLDLADDVLPVESPERIEKAKVRYEAGLHHADVRWCRGWGRGVRSWQEWAKCVDMGAQFQEHFDGCWDKDAGEKFYESSCTGGKQKVELLEWLCGAAFNAARGSECWFLRCAVVVLTAGCDAARLEQNQP